MASVPAAMGEPMVTIKVFYDGATRRGKMPLREMVPPVLEQHIRTFLHIPAETETLIERYSDSAAAYVLLDSANTAVYKQLYRAAKAKSKLKFRVTLKNTEEKTVPQPVTVEEESEVAASTVSPAETKTDDVKEKEPQTEVAAVADVAASVPQPPSAGSQTTLPLRNPSLSKTYDLSNLKSAAELAKESQEVFRQQFETRLQSLIDRREALVTTMSQQQEKNRALLSSLNQDAEQSSEPAAAQPPAPPATFAVCCNSCERTMPDAHYHCGTCDDGDFDLCQSCVDMGISCYSTDHWLIKRTIVDGHIVSSTTETIAPKRIAKASEPQVPAAKPEAVEVPKPSAPVNPPAERWVPFGNVRTCNACIRELPEKEFLHCDDCEDFDLCQRCFAQGKHGHHPKHRFVVAVADATVPAYMKAKMLPGRNQLHHAICDGCDKYVTGVRHKCLDCPDWDYCSTCFEVASFVHPNHRFAPIYEPLADVRTHNSLQSVHVGICCDGPLCSAGQGRPTYIRGIRYKCAVCHDLDFCANCEACPSNEHNKTHPLIKFKTPVRHVSVTTTGEHHGGKRMPLMGDRVKSEEAVSVKREATSSPSINAIQTVVDMEPSEPAAPVKEEAEEQAAEPVEEVKQESTKEEPVSTTSAKPVDEESLCAIFVKDSVADGSILPSNHVFEQTWVLRNDGNVSWPAGCSVKFVGGDYMGHVDSAHPADVSELESASESTICNAPLAPGQEFAFTVLLRTPARAGKIVSYWRLATPDGIKFGHRLWCDVNVRLMKPASEPKEEEETLERSNLMFPKLEKESPVASIHMDAPSGAASSSDRATETANSEVEDVVEDAEWDGSDDGFMTDEEYDILDASDEEYLEEQQKKHLRK